MTPVIATVVWIVGVFVTLVVILRKKDSLIDTFEYPLLGAMLLLMVLFIGIDILPEAVLDRAGPFTGFVIIFLCGSFPGLAAAYYAKALRDRSITYGLLASVFLLTSSAIVSGMLLALERLYH